MFMISVLPQTEHLHRNANGLTAETQLQLVAGCFIGSALLVGLGLDLPGAVDHDNASVVVFNRPWWWEAAMGHSSQHTKGAGTFYMGSLVGTPTSPPIAQPNT